jgi:microcystin-dependent protein
MRMTISSSSNKAQFNGSGSTGPFPFTFKVFDQSDLDVIRTNPAGVETTLVLTTDYTVSLNADQNNNPGGSVTTVAAVASGNKLTVLRVVDPLQETDITNGGGFYPEVVENALDRLTMLVQQVDEGLSRALSVPITSTQTPPDYLAEVTANVNAANASASAAAGSASTASTSATNATNAASSASISAASATTSASNANTSATNAANSAAAAQVAKITWLGAWSSATAYVLRDAVAFGGRSYICKLGHTNQTPTNTTYWDLLADKGADGAGSGDVLSNTATSVDSEIALFSATNGKLIKRATTTGLLKATSGVLASAVAGTDYLVPPSGTSILKANSGGALANATGTDITAAIGASAVTNATNATGTTTASVVTSALGSGTANATKVLLGDRTWGDPPASATTGEVSFFAMNTAPTGYLKANGAAVSRTTYAALFAAITKSAVATITIATPGVVTWTSHGLSANDPVRFTTTGALPTGLVANTTYFVVGASITTNTFQLSATSGGAAIATSGTQSGVQTTIHAPHGVGDGSTTFNVPDFRGEFLRGWDDGRAVDANRAFGSAQVDDLKSHSHTLPMQVSGSGSYGAGGGGVPMINGSGSVTGAAGGTETRPRNVALLACIKF